MNRILLVDDDPLFLEIAKRTLEHHGFQVVTAENGIAADALDREAPVDLLITDLEMPQRGGLETIMAFRQRSGRRPVIAVSGAVLARDGVLLTVAGKLGADRTFQKPVSGTELVAAVRDLLHPPMTGSKATSLLMLEDDPVYADLVVRMLETDLTHHFEVVTVSSLAKGLEHVRRSFPKVILTDLGLDDSHGLDTYHRLREAAPDSAIVVLTGSIEDELGIAAVRAGAQDYILKTELQGRWISRMLMQAIERKNVERALNHERKRSEGLLLSLLPAEVARRLQRDEPVLPSLYPSAAVLFCDLVGFTPLARTLEPAALIELLNNVFSTFDQLAQALGMEKIKTIGDAYMAVAGVPTPLPDCVGAAATMALGIFSKLDEINTNNGTRLNFRIGISTGPVMAGIIGIDKISFDLWGDTVNLASRLESHGLPGRIQVCEQTYRALREHFVLEERGEIEIKGLGPTKTWFLHARKFSTA